MRTTLLTSTLGVALFLSTPACGPTSKTCTPASCTGCCDASGACQAGNSNAACGVSGGLCATCQGGLSCTFGVCGSGGVGGGNSSGGGSGGGGGTTGGGSGGGTTGGGTGGGGGSSSSATQFCLDVVGAQIAFYGRCGSYSSAGLTSLRAEYESRCMNIGFFSPALADGRATFDASAASSCLAALRNATCTLTNPPGYQTCADVFAGAVGANGLCYDTSDCTSALYCDTSMTCPGRCVARVAVGQSVTSTQDCVAGAESYGGVCTALVALGQPCAPTGGSTARHGCVQGAVCGPADQCIAWTATMLQGNGQPCNTTGLECGEGLNCVASVCTPMVTAGNACDTVRQCQRDLQCGPANTCVVRAAAGGACAYTQDCASGLFCERPTGSTMGTCAPLRAVDQTCANGGQCVSGLFCTGTSTTPGVCKAPYAIGAACTYNPSAYNQCGEGYCTATSTATSGVCANKKIAGATCTSFNECQGSCTGGQCTPPSYCYDATP